MTLPIYQVDAFTDTLFGGNPAAVIPLQSWLPDVVMQQIALENNLSETVFFVPAANEEWDYDIRWFTPEIEINLCGHATLASAFILFTQLGFAREKLVFHSKSGLLTIRQMNGLLLMDFPSWKPQPATLHPERLSDALGGALIESVHQYRDWLVVLPDETAVQNCRPDFSIMKTIPEKIIITARGVEADFVSRFFAPTAGVDEDPVTGSAHSQLIPYWSEVLGKTELTARQLSRRGGKLWCRQLSNERVEIGGQSVFYMKGEIYLPGN
jgi:PhzF family phenazine biosynthesis protein